MKRRSCRLWRPWPAAAANTTTRVHKTRDLWLRSALGLAAAARFARSGRCRQATVWLSRCALSDRGVGAWRSPPSSPRSPAFFATAGKSSRRGGAAGFAQPFGFAAPHFRPGRGALDRHRHDDFGRHYGRKLSRNRVALDGRSIARRSLPASRRESRRRSPSDDFARAGGQDRPACPASRRSTACAPTKSAIEGMPATLASVELTSGARITMRISSPAVRRPRFSRELARFEYRDGQRAVRQQTSCTRR